MHPGGSRKSARQGGSRPTCRFRSTGVRYRTGTYLKTLVTVPPAKKKGSEHCQGKKDAGVSKMSENIRHKTIQGKGSTWTKPRHSEVRGRAHSSSCQTRQSSHLGQCTLLCGQTWVGSGKVSWQEGHTIFGFLPA